MIVVLKSLILKKGRIMISIKRNSKGMKQEATGRRKRASSFYARGQNDPFKISRSKFTDFLKCKRCFFLDRVKGLQEPGMPGWSLNVACDELLKKEFDLYREQQQPHPIMSENSYNFVPFTHEDINLWRNSLKGGISYHDAETNIILFGGVDDIWLDRDTEEMVVVDYKAQSSRVEVTTENYLENHFHEDYKKQMDVYVHILRKMGHKVSPRTFFLVVNASKEAGRFDNRLSFSSTLVPYNADPNWIDNEIVNLKETLDSNNVPERNPCCENCAYIEQGAQI